MRNRGVAVSAIMLLTMIAWPCSHSRSVASGIDAIVTSSGTPENTISVVGSSTVFPFMRAAIRAFSKDATSFVTELESTGTGAGMRFFCAGAGKGFPDITNASRPITVGEAKVCAQNGVKRIIPIRIGYDGITAVMPKNAAVMSLKSSDLYKALADYLPSPTGFVQNTARTWKDVNPTLPDKPILVLGPPKTSGTRDFLESDFMLLQCRIMAKSFSMSVSSEQNRSLCKKVREGGAYIDAGEDDSFLIKKVLESKEIVGLVGFGHALAFKDQVQFLPVDGHFPAPVTIRFKLYPLARPMFVYIKGDHVAFKPGLKNLANFIASEDVLGPDGLLAKIGLVVHDTSIRVDNRIDIRDMRSLKCPSASCQPLK